MVSCYEYLLSQELREVSSHEGPYVMGPLCKSHGPRSVQARGMGAHQAVQSAEGSSRGECTLGLWLRGGRDEPGWGLRGVRAHQVGRGDRTSRYK